MQAQPKNIVEGMDQHPTAVTVSDLNLFYGDSQALKDVNMIIPEKQVTAFIGPSGCGKSTLLRCFNRLNDLIEVCIFLVQNPQPNLYTRSLPIPVSPTFVENHQPILTEMLNSILPSQSINPAFKNFFFLSIKVLE